MDCNLIIIQFFYSKFLFKKGGLVIFFNMGIFSLPTAAHGRGLPPLKFSLKLHLIGVIFSIIFFRTILEDLL